MITKMVFCTSRKIRRMDSKSTDEHCFGLQIPASGGVEVIFSPPSEGLGEVFSISTIYNDGLQILASWGYHESGFLHLPQPLQRRGARVQRPCSDQLFTGIQWFL